MSGDGDLLMVQYSKAADRIYERLEVTFVVV